MIYISHRGNTEGSDPDLENTKYSINKCLSLGLDVEIDVWYVNNDFYLGHNFPKEKINETYLMNPRLWCHAKNTDALLRMRSNRAIHCFWHDTDNYTITSNGIIWAYPGQTINNFTVCVKPESSNYLLFELEQAYAICSDNILYYIRYLSQY